MILKSLPYHHILNIKIRVVYFDRSKNDLTSWIRINPYNDIETYLNYIFSNRKFGINPHIFKSERKIRAIYFCYKFKFEGYLNPNIEFPSASINEKSVILTKKECDMKFSKILPELISDKNYRLKNLNRFCNFYDVKGDRIVYIDNFNKFVNELEYILSTEIDPY